MNILGISAHYHDSAAALIMDGDVACATEEERFSRIKHDNGFPFQAIDFCLRESKLDISNVDAVAYYEKPLLKFERILETFVETYPRSLNPFLKSIPDWLGQKIKIEHLIRKKLKYKGNIYFIPHHYSHAASTFYVSPFDEAAILTIDGVGEYQTTGLWTGENQKITPLKQLAFPNSLGLLYSTFTSFLGFKVNDDEYKVMGLAAYGKPIYVDKLHKMIGVKVDGSFKLNLDYFSFRESFRMWSQKFENLFGKPRLPNEPMTLHHKNLAASIQKTTEEIYFKMLNHLFTLTKSKNLCLSGGVALNALANGKIYQNTPFKKIYVLGAAGDSGAATGAGLFVYHSILGNKKRNHLKTLALGSSYSNSGIKDVLDKYSVSYECFHKRAELIEKVAILLSQNKVVGWFQGKMEFGPRALGSRSILANPKPRWMKERVNLIKIREQFRPFAGSVLQEKVHELFEVPEKNHFSPFMIFCFQVKPEKRKEISAIVHKDGTCRIQTVNQGNGPYYQLIKKFCKITGVPCVLNTSFNLKGEPIVENPRQAIEDFLRTKMDFLVIGDF